jgi:hypothetical protein
VSTSGEEENLWPPPETKPQTTTIPTAISAPVTLSEDTNYEALHYIGSSLFCNILLNMFSIGVAVGVLAADSQSTSSSGYRASLWGPRPDLYFSSFLD